jgi:hypothetical protein
MIRLPECGTPLIDNFFLELKPTNLTEAQGIWKLSLLIERNAGDSGFAEGARGLGREVPDGEAKRGIDE